MKLIYILTYSQICLVIPLPQPFFSASLSFSIICSYSHFLFVLSLSYFFNVIFLHFPLSFIFPSKSLSPSSSIHNVTYQCICLIIVVSPVRTDGLLTCKPPKEFINIYKYEKTYDTLVSLMCIQEAEWSRGRQGRGEGLKQRKISTQILIVIG